MRKFLMLGAAALALAACGYAEPTTPAATVKQTQAVKAAEAANSLHFTENAEIDNIKRRLELTSSPGKVGFVLLLNQAGQPIMYTSVKGKITSGSKRLTSPEMLKDGVDCGEAYCEQIMQSPSDEGTYGSSDAYVFFWTADGQYIQWNGGYLYSDKPFRTNIKPLVIAQAAE